MDKILMRLWMLSSIMFASISVQAQKIQTVDTEGNPVGYASVSDADNGRLIGTTDLKGYLADVGGVRSIAITHVAFNPQVVTVGTLPPDGRITLQDANFELPEVTVKKKEFIYVQTYYRVFLMSDDTLIYYRSGVTDNAYNIRKKTVSSDHDHFSKAQFGILKFTLDNLVGGMINRYSDLSINNVALKSKDSASKLKLVKETPERQRVLYQDSLIGYLVDDKKDHKRRLSIDNNLYKKFYHADNDSERKAKKREKRNEKKKNETSTRYMVYNLDDDGNCGVADFVSKQIHSDYDKYSKINKKDEHRRLWVEVYATDRAYVTKQELKEKKRENKMKMSYEALMQFERQHGIPAMPENTKKSLEELLSK